MKIGLIDADGHGFPNLALMRISAYHKAQGDVVEWHWTDFIHHDIVYMSKVFSNDYTPAPAIPLNADRVIQGGTGYAISLNEKQREYYCAAKDKPLSSDIEKMFPDYDLYPQYNFAVSMTTRGCPRGCPFCHVAVKEGRRSEQVANVADFWSGQKIIKVLDANITACTQKRDLMRQYRNTGAIIEFNQGLDIRLLDGADVDDLNDMRIRQLHFAWDNARDDLTDYFRRYAQAAKHKPRGCYASVYVLTNYDTNITDDLKRIYSLRDMGYDPYVMIYDKPHAPRTTRALQRWCNNKYIFKSCLDFNDYTRK